MTRKMNIPLVYLASFIGSMHFLAAVMIPFYREWAELSYREIFALQAIFGTSILFLEIPTGIVADKFGRKLSVILAEVTLAGSFLLYGAVNHFWAFALGEAICGLGFTLQSGAWDAWIYDLLKRDGREEESAHIFAWKGGLESFGIAVGSLVGVYIAARTDWNYPMLFTAIPLVVCAVILCLIEDPSKTESQEKVEKRPSCRQLIGDFRAVWREKPDFRKICVAYAIFVFVGPYVFWLYGPKFLSIGFPYELWGYYAALMNMISLACAPIVKKFQRIRRGILPIGFSIVAGSYITLAFTEILPVVMVLLMVIPLIYFTWSALFVAALNADIQSRSRATVLSVLGMGIQLARVIFDLFLGTLLDINVNIAILLMGLILAAGMPVAFLVKPASDA